MATLSSWTSRLLDLLLPRLCGGCRRELAHDRPDPLCGECLRRLRPAAAPLRRCGNLPVWGVYVYEPPLSELIHAFKYDGRQGIGGTLGAWMAGFMPLLGLETMDAVVPVPLHPARLQERGFNQSAILASAVAASAGVPMLDLLERHRRTKPQWRLGRQERADNVRGAFRPALRAGAGDARGLRLTLVDDVCTTGGTLVECAEALRSAGAASVQGFVLALD
ncbi:MAG: ComF family protein [Elusimicrobia bacterium]|nr:ComF family protein [Elusimicrobiota bacterium]